ncbi:MAG: hypothetical protein V7K21_16735 [Nostoc sp.]|uniref:hypothetical protein n=1 Tax=Nostoc sp. TaxID=1180 RepID=UPI002FF59B4D
MGSHCVGKRAWKPPDVRGLVGKSLYRVEAALWRYRLTPLDTNSLKSPPPTRLAPLLAETPVKAVAPLLTLATA